MTRLAISALLVCAKATVVVGVSFALFIGSGVVAAVVHRVGPFRDEWGVK